ncbi:MAG: hypothetical protein WC307_01020 [Candidatus Nanoarchaeia archaeon]|jgi:hypothetical protein
MVDINEYVKRLNEMRTNSSEDYSKAMNNYKTNYPEFYNKLIEAMGLKQKTKQSRIKEFFSLYKWYLIAIAGGLTVIIYLLYLLMNR